MRSNQRFSLHWLVRIIVVGVGGCLVFSPGHTFSQVTASDDQARAWIMPFEVNAGFAQYMNDYSNWYDERSQTYSGTIPPVRIGPTLDIAGLSRDQSTIVMYGNTSEVLHALRWAIAHNPGGEDALKMTEVGWKAFRHRNLPAPMFFKEQDPNHAAVILLLPAGDLLLPEIATQEVQAEEFFSLSFEAPTLFTQEFQEELHAELQTVYSNEADPEDYIRLWVVPDSTGCSALSRTIDKTARERQLTQFIQHITNHPAVSLGFYVEPDVDCKLTKGFLDRTSVTCAQTLKQATDWVSASTGLAVLEFGLADGGTQLHIFRTVQTVEPAAETAAP